MNSKKIPLPSVKLTDKMLAPRIEQCIKVTIPTSLQKCRDTGRIDAFKLEWTENSGKECPHIYWDSDVAKVLEAVAYSLAISPDEELEKYYDELVDLIVSAQQPDGYLNTHFTVTEKDQRWQKLNSKHELYCAGHLMEAAVAGFEQLGKRKFLDAMCRYADYIDSVFGEAEGKRYGIPGHEEIELALVKLYRATGVERYLKLAEYFINARGRDPEFFSRESGYPFEPEIYQAHKPVREQSDAVGHAVRALYLYCGMADVGKETGDETLITACKRLWKSITEKRMYISGGVGSSFFHEAFTTDYDLPNHSRSYAESCAGIALALFAHRMSEITGQAGYLDTLERALFNVICAGISLSGDEFFYSNFLEMNDNFVSYNFGNRTRQKWFFCSCCPTSYCRFFTQLPRMIWSEDGEFLRLNIPVANVLTLPDKCVEVIGNYPQDNRIKVIIRRAGSFKFAMRIPGFAKSAVFRCNGEICTPETVNGFARFDRNWQDGDEISCELDMPFELIRCHEKVSMNRGKAAIMRGPLLYCCENIDHDCDVSSLLIDRKTDFTVEESSGLENISAVKCRGLAESGETGQLYSNAVPQSRTCVITAIPYAWWQNRGETNMTVWLREY